MEVISLWDKRTCHQCLFIICVLFSKLNVLIELNHCSVVFFQDNNSSSSLTILTSSHQTITLQRPGIVSLDCTGSGDNTTSVFWVRHNNQSTSIRINGTEISYSFLNGTPIWQADLRDQPPSDKYPYRYQCLALNKCCPTVKSGFSTVMLALSPNFNPLTPGKFNSAKFHVKKQFKSFLNSKIPRNVEMGLSWDLIFRLYFKVIYSLS